MSTSQSISTREQKAIFLRSIIICLIAVGTLSCRFDEISSIETSKGPQSVSASSTPTIRGRQKVVDDWHENQEASSNNSVSKPIKIKCKDAKENDRLVCDTIVPDDQSEDLEVNTPFPLEITYCGVDLNGDGENEFVVWESSWAGTSGGGLWVLRKSPDGYAKIFETEMTWTPIILLPSKHHGWNDFAYFQTGAGVKPSFATVSYDNQSYNADGALLPAGQIDGKLLIPRTWDSSTFGPVSEP